MKVVEIRNNSILVQTDHEGQFTIAKYEDENGVWFYNENLEKQYVSDTEKVKKEPEPKQEPEPGNKIPPNKKGRFTFRATIYARDGWSPGRTFIKTFKANDIDEAEEKLESHYGNIFDAELIKAKDAEGNTIHPFS